MKNRNLVLFLIAISITSSVFAGTADESRRHYYTNVRSGLETASHSDHVRAHTAKQIDAAAARGDLAEARRLIGNDAYLFNAFPEKYLAYRGQRGFSRAGVLGTMALSSLAAVVVVGNSTAKKPSVNATEATVHVEKPNVGGPLSKRAEKQLTGISSDENKVVSITNAAK